MTVRSKHHRLLALKYAALLGVVLLCVMLAACDHIDQPAPKTFYSQTKPPAKQEFRWSNGKMPKSFDPARAAAAPETDIVRAIFEGLTDLDPNTLKAVPAVAERWESTPDFKVWTFYLRKDAKWSNDEHVIASDFVISWRRFRTLGDKVAHRELIQNIVGLQAVKSDAAATQSAEIGNEHPAPTATDTPTRPDPAVSDPQKQHEEPPAAVKPESSVETAKTGGEHPAAKPSVAPKLGIEAVNDLTLKVTLVQPDPDLPQLVANPIFRPIYGDGVEFETDPLDDDVVTNGAFTVDDVDDNGVSLNRSDTYWNQAAVTLERVQFVPVDSAEKALDAYRAGSVDAVTNADFEPLALKLLTPFEDFRKATHGALNFYEFNAKNAPFNDRRVREALAISIDRDRITDGELEGAAQPAYSFLPLGDSNTSELTLDVGRAQSLLEKAGYPNGAGFPPIRLVINRNDTQQRVARAVSRMWKQNLNLDTQIIVKEPSEIDQVRSDGSFDLLRRGAVMPTSDEMASLASVFGPARKADDDASKMPKHVEPTQTPRLETSPQLAQIIGGPAADPTPGSGDADEPGPPSTAELSEENAIYNVYAIPLYFPRSYSLVKPYVHGFDMNGLDAPSIKELTIDNTWQPNTGQGES